MKVAYISPVYFSDVDMSLLPYLQGKVKLDYYLQVTKNVHKFAAIDINRLNDSNGVIPIATYTELNHLGNLISPNNSFIVNNNCNLYSLKSFVCGFKLFIKIAKSKYDIIHLTEFPHIHEFFLYLLRKKIVLTVHDPFPHSSVKSKSISFRRWLAFKLIKKFIILNESQKEDFLRINNIERENVFDSKLSCYDYLHIYDKRLNKKENQNYILFFGQITSHKGVDDLLEAMEEVHKKHDTVKLIVAGKWKWDFDYSKYEGLDYIEIINRFIPDFELAMLIKYSKFVVVPYHDATQSGVIMSAFAFDKPCIATNVGGLPEMVINNKFGIIIPPKDVDSLVISICELLESKELLEVYSNNIYMKYHHKESILSWNFISNQIIDIYKKVLK